MRFTNREQQILLREHGVQTRQQLAELNPVLARQVRGASAATVARSTEEHLGRSIDKLDELLYRARVAVSKSSLLICDPGSVSCPTADVEVDIDMESYDDVTYLWGALVTTRRSVAGVTDGYFPFVSWEPLTGQVESDVFRSFWQWFSDLSVTVRDAGANLAAYCFWAQAENSAMNRAASFDGDASLHAAISDFRRREPSEWIDLHDVIKHQIQTDGPLGLKKLAQATGFSWRETNPSGEASMTWYEHAVESTNEAAILARTRLLEYNEDDCRATRALREWLNSDAHQLAHRDEWP